MRSTVAPDFKSELRLTARLGSPLALGELGWMSTYIVDALMIGRLPHSALPIAASSLGNTIFYAIAFCAIYLLNGLETLIAQAFGRAEDNECTHLLLQSLWIVLVATPVVMAATLGSLRLLPHFGTPAEIVGETSRYVHALVWSTGPLMLYMALRRFLQSVNRVTLVSVSLVTASVVNLFFDWVYLFGHFGARAMGVAGSGWATCVVRVYMLLLLAGGTVWAFRKDGYHVDWSMLLPNGPRLKALLRIGWPSGLEYFEELGISTYMSILCARLGTVLLAAHQVVLDLNAFVYQVPNGISYVTIMRVGQSAGQDNLPAVKRAANASLWICLGFMTIAATVFAAFAKFWAGLYTNSPEVVVAAAPIFAICAFLLLGDTLFVVLASAFTGLGDTRSPMLVSLVWNWAIGMPLAYMLGFHYGLTLKGLWIGRAIGSVGAGVTLLALWRHRLKEQRLAPHRRSLNLLQTLPATDRAA